MIAASFRLVEMMTEPPQGTQSKPPTVGDWLRAMVHALIRILGDDRVIDPFVAIMLMLLVLLSLWK
jgi:hypothetical protein